MKKGETLNNIGKEKVIISHTFLDGICWWLSNIFLIFFFIPDKHCVEFHLLRNVYLARTTLCSGHFYLHPPLGSVHLLMHFWRITISQPAVRFLIDIQPVVDGRPFYFHHSISLLLFFYSSTNHNPMYRAQHTIWLDVTKQEGWKKRKNHQNTERQDGTARHIVTHVRYCLFLNMYVSIFSSSRRHSYRSTTRSVK